MYITSLHSSAWNPPMVFLHIITKFKLLTLKSPPWSGPFLLLTSHLMFLPLAHHAPATLGFLLGPLHQLCLLFGVFLSSVWSDLHTINSFSSCLLNFLPQMSPPQRGLHDLLVWRTFPQTLTHHLSLVSIQPLLLHKKLPPKQFVIIISHDSVG